MSRLSPLLSFTAVLAFGAVHPVQAVQAPADEILLPLWDRTPSDAERLAAYPKRALEDDQAGLADIVCAITRDGRPIDCKVKAQSPTGMGFGAAALKVAPGYHARVGAVENQRYLGGSASIRVYFHPPYRPMVSNPSWTRRPTPAEMQLAYPPDALSKGQSGGATFLCKATAQGRLAACKLRDETPKGAGFAEAAGKLLPLFQMQPRDKAGLVEGRSVQMPIRFRPPVRR